MRLVRLALLSPGLTLLTACAPPPPIPLPRAEAECRAQPYVGRSPRTSVGIGVGSGGWSSVGVGIDLTPGAGQADDPAMAYYDCVVRKSGQPPKHPLY
ncbi:MAG: hypothetical protein JSR87_10110 [Proteobacteria bacterium]|nr:hypothetical protein [Pseudomonadota bacterium]